MTCLLDTSYLSSPEFIYQSLYIMSIIGAPVYLLGAWLIIFRSPKNMDSIKWPMLNLQLSGCFLDLLISVLITPYALFPSIAGYPMGILYRIGVSSAIQVHIMVTLIGIVLLAMLTVYENQYYLLSIKTGSWPTWRVTFLTGYYILMSTFLIPFTATIPNQKTLVDLVFERLPCIANVIDKSRVFVYTLRFSAAFFTCGAVFSITILLMLFFITLTIRILLRNSGTLSQKTLRLQKKFLTGLIIQTSVPVVVMLFPGGYLVLTVANAYYNQAYNNFTILVLSTHGLLSTLAMLLTHQPYRSAVLKCFVTCPRKSKFRVSVTMNI